MKNKIASLLHFGVLMLALLSATTRQDKSPIRAISGGYVIDFGESSFDKATTDGRALDLILVDFRMLSQAKTTKDSLAIMDKIYANPALFSIVSGKASYMSSSSVMIYTKSKFKFDPSNSLYTLIVVDNDGNDNSGAPSAAPVIYRQSPKCTCTARPCGCCCIRKKDRSCLTCSITIKQ
ncbi:MAG: hypothetical protein R2822_23040 [Spirosomataceae bacterium]